jgi:Mrp family chromosome partitioning ATPase
MDQNEWTIVGVTSPTAECGKSVIAANLAFSAARQPYLDVLLADFDLLLRDRTDIEGCLTPARASARPLLVLPTTAAEDPSQYTNYDAAGDALERMRRGLPAGVIVVDLPPVLTSDDGASILRHVDCIVLVTAAGSSKVADVEQCAAQLRENNVVRVVVNKTQDKAS